MQIIWKKKMSLFSQEFCFVEMMLEQRFASLFHNMVNMFGLSSGTVGMVFF